MNRYLFLTAWLEGSDSAGGELTQVHVQDDLWTQYLSNNPHIFAVEVLADSIDIANVYGRAKAWSDNYTAYDTVSVVVKLDEDYQHPCFLMVITAHPQSS